MTPHKPRVPLIYWRIKSVGEARVLMGIIGEGHPSIAAGHSILTAEIVYLNDDIAETHSIIYVLGEPGDY